MIIIVDFGSQTTHLISRRIGELGTQSQIVVPEKAVQLVKKMLPKGIILSGGPASVFEPDAPRISKQVFSIGIPVLGICYGQQLTALLLGGKVKTGKIKEYGPVELHTNSSPLFNHIPTRHFQVWMSHGIEVAKLPPGFISIAKTENITTAAMACEQKHIYGVQFHPEVMHTDNGLEILRNFLNICGETPCEQQIDIDNIVASIKETVANKKVVMAFSGGTDSFVAAALITKAVGRNLIPAYVDSGLMRDQALHNVSHIFPKLFGFKPRIIRAKQSFLRSLKGITDPEQKRKSIGALYVKLFENMVSARSDIAFLGQGTTYADFIHSKSTKHSALIKSHHNVGGLPKQMKLKLLEPIRYFYTDQVRFIGTKLGLPDAVVYQQPFPGPGFAVRIMGEVTSSRLAKVKQADTIVLEEFAKANLQDQVFQYFAILTNASSTAIKGDGRFYGEVVAIRAYTTKDRMTADWAKIPFPVLQKISARIVNEVPEVSRVVYDITTKPPATMEWE